MTGLLRAPPERRRLAAARRRSTGSWVVSRPFVIKLLEEKKIPHRKVGRHRRIVLHDLLDYRHKIHAERQKVLDELTAEAQRLGIG